MNTFTATPSATVLDNRGLTVRNIAYHRHPDTLDSTDERITRHCYDIRGFLAQSSDPRLYEAGLFNINYINDLNGVGLRIQSADAGTTIALNDSGDRPFLNISNVNSENDRSQAITRTYQYEENSLPGRPLCITEQGKISERLVWAGNSADEQSHNLAGQLVSHYDPAGLLSTNSIPLSGVPLSVTRQLLPDDAEANWQGADASAWNDLLAGETYTTTSTVDAAGNVLTTLDAKGNVQRVAYDVAGLLKGSWLAVKGGSEQIIVKSLSYSAAGQKLREEHGNGVVTTYSYEAETQRLVGIKTERTTAAKVLQDLRYGYDPVGNVLVITNDAEETRFWRNQEVVPENTYTYDSLYQLISASGREMANAVQQSSSRPDYISFDNATYTNYSRIYTYDNAGNLTKIQHSAPASGNNYTTSMTVSDRSNRAVLSTFTENPADVEALFTAGGQQKQLLPGQTLNWTPRQELQQVTPVTRDGAADDKESYRYDASSQRIVKITSQLTGNTMQTKRVIYLPGLELRSSSTENLQVITIGATGRAQVRVLHWESGQPAGISNDQIRYSYDNLTGSSALEVDGNGELISQEEYYPYGGTALFAARSQMEADYKTIRYSGKEQDATGLYYYGWRYYQSWAGRWLSADPAGTVDGLNLFRMVRNNPVTFYDDNGLQPNQVAVRNDKHGYIYAPFIAPDLVVQGLGINIVRHTKGKPLYPIIVADEQSLHEMENLRLAKAKELKARIDKLSDALQGMEKTLKASAGWTSASLRNQLNPELFEATIQGVADFSRDLSVLQRITFLSNTDNTVLKNLSADMSKIYIIGHGGAGMDVLAADQNMEHGMTTAELLAETLTIGGLDYHFNDIRVRACYSADAMKPESFAASDLEKSAKLRGGGFLGLGKNKTKSFAQSLKEALVKRGYLSVTVSGYHGAGVTFSKENWHTRRLPQKSDIRSSLVRRNF